MIDRLGAGAITRPSSLAVRMPPCHGGGRRFKSDLGRHFITHALLAQSVEQRTENPRVDSSNLFSHSNLVQVSYMRGWRNRQMHRT